MDEPLTLAGWDKSLDEMTLREMTSILQLLRWRIVESEFVSDSYSRMRTHYTVVTDEVKDNTMSAVWPAAFQGLPVDVLWQPNPESAARMALRLHFTILRRERDEQPADA